MAEAAPNGSTRFSISNNALIKACEKGRIKIVNPHTRGHFNCDIDPTKSGVTSIVDPQKN